MSTPSWSLMLKLIIIIIIFIIISIIIIMTRISLSEIKEHDWVTMYGLNPLLKEEENCQLIEVRILEKLIEVSLERLVEMKHNLRKAYWAETENWKWLIKRVDLQVTWKCLLCRWLSTKFRTVSGPSPSLTPSSWSRYAFELTLMWEIYMWLMFVNNL